MFDLEPEECAFTQWRDFAFGLIDRQLPSALQKFPNIGKHPFARAL
jgi:hypothetical protein